MKIWKWIQNKVQKKKSHLIFFSEEKIFSWYTAQKLIWPTEWKVHWEVSIPLTGDDFMIHFSYLQERKHIYFYYVKARKTVISAIPICHPLDSIAFTSVSHSLWAATLSSAISCMCNYRFFIWGGLFSFHDSCWKAETLSFIWNSLYTIM